jgi:predicted Zn-dependent protease
MIIRSVVLAFILSAIAGCATNPVTGKSELTFVSKDQEIAIGQQQYSPAQQTQGGQYSVDADLTAYVQQIGQRLAKVSDSELPYEFVVLNNSTPNAWALPGGKIAINRGLLLQLESEAELAAVLAHEIVHAAARHGAKSMERSMLLQGAMLLTAIGTSDSDYSNYIMGGASVGAQLISQRYGRQAELDSDYYGMHYMAKAGYDPAAAISLQEKFVALNKDSPGGWVNGLFASHPPSQQRVDTNTQTNQTIRSQQRRDWEHGTQRYKQQLAYLTSKQPAYQAFDQANALLAKKEISVAEGRLKRAIELEPKEARFYGLHGDLLLNKNNLQSAIVSYDEALQRDDNYFEYFLGRGMAFSKLGERDKARADLERSNQLLPTAIATNQLGVIALQSGDKILAKKYFVEVANTQGALSQSARASYVRLDVEDNPSKYFQISSERRDSRFFATVENKSGLPIKSAQVQFSAVINGQQRQARRTTGSMAVDGRAGIFPGWRLNEEDTVEQINVEVIAVGL